MCFAEVKILISVVCVVNEVFGVATAYFVRSRRACVSCTVQNETCNFGEAQTASSLTMVYVNRNTPEHVL